ncbi:MAG: exodeoxyribonuclease VII large subunit, partial [Nitrospirota bacterium]|nr:exodeoxyribonuclease VII large subunit [Nitrospirota bacterium]
MSLRPILTVSQLTAQIKDCLEGGFPDIWVEGELSNYKSQPSGHTYFTLKDAGGSIRGVIFRSYSRFLKFQPR